MSELAPTVAGELVDPIEAAWSDVDRAAEAEAHKVAFWHGHERIAATLGCELVVRKSAARWDDTRHPPQLLEATVRFKRPGYKRPKPARGGCYVPRG